MVRSKIKKALRIKGIFIGLAVLFSWVFLAEGWAAEEAEETKFKIKPMISVDGRFDSNFFLTEDNERGVYTYVVAPGVMLGMETPKLKIDLNYTLEAHFYDEKGDTPLGEQSAQDLNYAGHLAALKARYDMTPRLTLGLDDSFYISRYPTYYERLSDSTDRRKYYINRLTPLVYYDFENKFSTGVRYQWEKLDYTESDYEDSTANRFFFDLLYNPSRTLTFDVGYQYWARDYVTNPPDDYRSNQISLAAQKRYKYSSFDGSVGYHNRSFDDPLEADANKLCYKVSITGENPPPPEIRRHLGEVPERARSHIYLAAEQNFNDVGETYTAQRFTLSAGHVFLGKILTLVRGYYQLSDYDSETGTTPDGYVEIRDDKTYNVYGRVGYLITKAMDISLTAGRETRDSNLAGFDYDNDYVYLRFDFNYDITSRGGFSEEAVYY